MERRDRPGLNKSAIRAIELLEDLAVAGPSPLGEIARRLGWDKATTHRFVRTLVEAGYALQDPVSRRYWLSLRLLPLANAVLDAIDIRSELRPVLTELAALTGETVHLGTLEQDEVVYIDKVDGRQAIRMASRVGLRAPCHSSALGKALLAHGDPAEWPRIIEAKGLPRRTARTITNPVQFVAELERTRACGYAVDDVENEDGIRCIGAPIRDHDATIVAALSLSGWTLTMTSERVRDELPAVILEFAMKASERLGYAAAAGDASQGG